MTKEYRKKHGVSMVLPAATPEQLEWLQFQLNSAYALLMGAMRDEQVKDIFARRNIRFALSDLEYFASPETLERNGRITHIEKRGDEDEYALVPVKPTTEMINAGMRPGKGFYELGLIDEDMAEDCYRSMIAAAPKSA